MNYAIYFWLFLKASLFSTGGMGNLPSLHADLTAHGWASERQFGESMTIGQISPGPNGLWVISLGYLTAGIPGSLLALAAIAVPPFLILGVERLYRRVQDHPAVEGFMQGIGLAVAGVFVVALSSILRSAGLNTHGVLIMLVSVGLASIRRMPIIGIVALAGLAGVLWGG